MTNPKCPVAKDRNCEKVAVVIQMYRAARADNQDPLEIRKQRDKYYWDKITSLVNEGEGQSHIFTRDDVLDMATTIKAFHERNSYECFGIYVANEIVVREIPRLPTLHERQEWNNADRLAPSIVNPLLGKSDMTFEGPNKRLRFDSGQSSEVPPRDYMYDSHPESSGHKLIKLMNHFKFTDDMKTCLAVQLANCPGIFPLICDDFKEDQILDLIRAIIPRDMYEKWYAEWSKK